MSGGDERPGAWVTNQRGVEAVEMPQHCCFPSLQESMVWFLCQEWVILTLVTGSAYEDGEARKLLWPFEVNGCSRDIAPRFCDARQLITKT